MDPTSPMTISNLLVHIPSRVASIDASMLPLTGDLRSGARADLRIQGTPHLLHLRMCTHASSCTPQCHLHPHHHLTLRHTSAPQLSHRCPRISQHSVDRNERASLQADWASLSLVHVLFSWRVGLYDFDFWGDLAYTCIVFINTSHEEKTEAHRQGRVNGRVPAPGAVRLLASRPLLPSASAAADIPRCRRGEGPLHGRPGHQAPVPVQMGTVYGSSGRGMLMVSNRAGELAGRASGKGAGGAAASPSRQTSECQFASAAAAQPVPAAAAGRGPDNPQNTPDTTQQDKPQPKGNTTKPVRLIKMSCL